MNHIPPRLIKDKQNKFTVLFYLNGKRYRVSNGKKFGLDLHPNKAAIHDRLGIANELLFKIHKALLNGWGQQTSLNVSFLEALQNHSFCKDVKETYKEAVNRTLNRLESFLKNSSIGQINVKHITTKHCIIFLHSKQFTSNSFNTERKHLSSFFNKLFKTENISNPVESIPVMKVKPTLHKPFKDVNLLLEDIKSFNENLFLCCLLTYGCLLRPHQEIRNLKWGDFSEDMKHISLSGKRNKSGRNRIVPLNPYILQYLHKGEDTDNIFTGSEKPFNKDYFKTLWSRYKAQSNVLEDLQTLYSFRHSGAIEIYKRTGSLTILQQAMGHASLAVTLGYLRGLEIPSLKLEDMPRL